MQQKSDRPVSVRCIARPWRLIGLRNTIDQHSRSYRPQEAAAKSRSKTNSTFALTDGQGEIIEELFHRAPPVEQSGQ